MRMLATGLMLGLWSGLAAQNPPVTDAAKVGAVAAKKLFKGIRRSPKPWVERS